MPVPNCYQTYSLEDLERGFSEYTCLRSNASPLHYTNRRHRKSLLRRHVGRGAGDRASVCANPDTNGKCVALQRRTARRVARCTLREDSLRLEHRPRDRMFIRRPDILWLPVGRLGTKPDYPKGRAARLCGDLYTDF